MFGNNPKRQIVKGTGELLFVKNIFKTLQAEGPYGGVPSVFIRLGGCNLACNFCDTEFEDFKEQSINDIIYQVQNLSKNSNGNQSIFMVVITGGEPLRQPINLLCKTLLKLNYKIQIETNGTLNQDLPYGVDIVCSPKVTNGKYHKINQELFPKITAFKYLISSNIKGYDNVPEVNLLSQPIFVQAMDEYDNTKNIANKNLAVKIALEYGYRLSYQIHKELNIE